ncbi:ZP domain-containing protein-like [Centropristis striata]|uniref:ZP domain-containing protein-like n=1 Tax=Centropristis striata TaxID=184440 RepID=UPI0027DFC9A2|nr:ZP domain-containing protein-like [Centropristis striata]
MVDNTADIITRKCLMELKFVCTYPKRGNVSQNFYAHREKVLVEEKGFGTFTYNFEFFPNGEYRAPFAPEEYPLRCEERSRIFMQIQATSSLSNMELFVENCRATPYDYKNFQPSYSIIEDGCKKDSTVNVHSSSNKRQFRFSLEAFKFIGQHDQVFISCSVLMCEVESPSTRCSQGCINSRARRDSRQHHQVKREAPNQSLRHFISQGPLRLKRSAESSERPVASLNLNLVFIAGCLLAAVGMICAAVTYKTKISRVKYQHLSEYES